MRTRSVAACLVVVVLTTGCTEAFAGKARPAPELTPRPLTGQTVKQVLLDGADLSKIPEDHKDRSDYAPISGISSPISMALLAGVSSRASSISTSAAPVAR
jgi:hypothetical protein